MKKMVARLLHFATLGLYRLSPGHEAVEQLKRSMPTPAEKEARAAREEYIDACERLEQASMNAARVSEETIEIHRVHS